MQEILCFMKDFGTHNCAEVYVVERRVAFEGVGTYTYGVATVSSIDKIVGLFCRI